jgi:hypothetical protein
VKPFLLAALSILAPAGAAQPGPVPVNCTVHTSFDGSADASGDYRCAGMAIQFHTAGVAHSPAPIWAGQWLFIDQLGKYRKGWCTFNRGTHPTIDMPSHSVQAAMPRDPGGAKAAYLAWRYGDTFDGLTAAGLWAVFHYYAADAAGSNRSANPASPLVPNLGTLAAASGRADLQTRAQQLDAEASAFTGEWQLQVAVDAAGLVRVSLTSGDTPVPEASVQVLVSGDDESHPLTTGADGQATVVVPISAGTITVAATAEAPGTAQAYRGVPAAPNPNGAQVLLVAGPPEVLHASATFVPPSTTSTSTTTTSTTLPPTTTSTTTTTVAPPTSTSTSTTTAQALPPTTVAPSSTPVPSAAPHPPLPRTGGGGDGWVSQIATAFLVGGVGLLGTLRRRPSPTTR